MTISRRTLLSNALLLGGGALGAGALSACGDKAAATPAPWHEGRIWIATGNTTGVYYQIGGGFADLITKYMPGYDAHAEASGASGENVQRVSSGDYELAFCNGDTAADAASGKGPFAGKPQRIVALSRIYRNYVHCVVRTSAKITKFSDLRGKRISTSSLNSGTDILAGRILQAGGLDPDKDVVRQRLSLPETTKGMQAGTTDAMFFTGGLPTPGITDLLAGGPNDYQLFGLDPELPNLTAKYGSVYGVATLPKATYNVAADVQTIVVFNMIVASPDMPEPLAYNLTKLLYDHQPELAKVHPEGGHFDKADGPKTDPVPLHPGARRFFDSK
jgi:uncharacterized protein